jgi:hypothetical protein
VDDIGWVIVTAAAATGTSAANQRRTRPAQLWKPALSAAVALTAVGVLAVVDPNEPGHYPLCPFHALTGLDCPGCGAMRAMHDLATGHVGAALDQNLLAVAFVPFIVGAWGAWLWRSWHGRPERPAVYPRWLPPVVLVATLVWWVVRNVPGVPFLPSGLG